MQGLVRDIFFSLLRPEIMPTEIVIHAVDFNEVMGEAGVSHTSSVWGECLPYYFNLLIHVVPTGSTR